MKPKERRNFIKQAIVGSVSITFAKLSIRTDASAQGEAAINTTLDTEVVFTPNSARTLNVPRGAKSMSVMVKGAGGGGARSRIDGLDVNGAAGGDASFYTRDKVDVRGISQLALHVGEGGQASESSEFGFGGEFGGGDGGPNLDSPDGRGSRGGGGGGGYSAVLYDNNIMIVAAGGGGAGNRGLTDANGGTGGAGDNAGEGGASSEPGNIPIGGAGPAFPAKDGENSISNGRLVGNVIGKGGTGSPTTNTALGGFGAGGGGGGGYIGGGGGGAGNRRFIVAELGIQVLPGSGAGGAGGLSYVSNRVGFGGEKGTAFGSGAIGNGLQAGKAGEIRITFSSSAPIVDDSQTIIDPAIDLLLSDD